MNQPEKSTGLESLVYWREWHKRDEAQRLFPSIHSLEWFMRSNEEALIASGAMLLFRQRWHFVVPEIESVMLAIVRKATDKFTSQKTV